MASTTAPASARDISMGAAVTLLLCFCTATIEGIDLQSMGLAAPKLAPEFHLAPGQLGMVLTASPIGLFFGAFVGGRLADVWGRKIALIIAMLVFGVFQLSTVAAPGYGALLAIRFACGLGLGGALPNLIALTSRRPAGATASSMWRSPPRACPPAAPWPATSPSWAAPPATGGPSSTSGA